VPTKENESYRPNNFILFPTSTKGVVFCRTVVFAAKTPCHPLFAPPTMAAFSVQFLDSNRSSVLWRLTLFVSRSRRYQDSRRHSRQTTLTSSPHSEKLLQRIRKLLLSTLAHAKCRSRSWTFSLHDWHGTFRHTQPRVGLCLF